MKKAGMLLLCGLMAAAFVGWTRTADARPQYKKEHDAKYKGSSIEAALEEVKCNACHYGKKKTDRNDYGQALVKAGLTKESFMEKKGDEKGLAKHIQESLEKALKEKSEGGQTFGDLIKAGKLPGTNPEE